MLSHHGKIETSHEMARLFQDPLQLKKVLSDTVMAVFDRRLLLLGLPTEEINTHVDTIYYDQLLKRLHPQIKAIARRHIAINPLVKDIAKQLCEFMKTMTDVEIRKILQKSLQETINGKYVDSFVCYLNDCKKRAAGLFVDEQKKISGNVWNNLVNEARKKISFTEQCGGLTGVVIVLLSVLLVLIASRAVIKRGLDEKSVISIIKELMMFSLAAKILNDTRLSRIDKNRVRIHFDIKDLQSCLLHAYESYSEQKQRHLQQGDEGKTDYVSLFMRETLPPPSPSSLSDVEQLSVPKIPKRKHLTTATQLDSLPLAKEDNPDSVSLQRHYSDGRGNTYVRLSNLRIFYRSHQDAFPEHDGLSDVIKKLLDTDPTLYPFNYNKNTLFKKIGKGEKEFDEGCVAKIKFHGKRFGHLRVAIGGRKPNALEEDLLGRDCEIYSPKKLVHK